jgi:glycosyltransferase involved in cell wall biosynthesis
MKVLFISHEASRTGAPLLLLKLIKWLINNKEVEPSILVINDGPLLEEFQNLGECYLWNDPSYNLSLVKKVWNKIFRTKKSDKAKKKINKILKHSKFDAIYFNSIVSLQLLEILPRRIFESKVIVHVHELNTIIQKSGLGSVINDSRIDQYIAVSEIVKDNLITNYSIKQEKIGLIHEYIDLEEWIVSSDTPIKEDLLIVAGIGYVHWRKGVDAFILIANEVRKKGYLGDFEFWWIGFVSDQDLIYLHNDLKKLGIEGSVKFYGEQKELNDFYLKIDVLALSSREDPYPTVALEAALFSIPFVCWNQGIGTAELALQGCGITVDYFDVSAMADAIIELKENADLRKELGENARKAAVKHDINILAEQIHGYFAI